ncbi:MAG: hypothetical protein R2854_11490 [Caldilineaceae bacterium]
MQPFLSSMTMPNPSLAFCPRLRQRCCNMLLIAAILLSIALPLATEPLPAASGSPGPWRPRTSSRPTRSTPR